MASIVMTLLSCNHSEKTSQSAKGERIETMGDTVLVPDQSPMQQHLQTKKLSACSYNSHYTTTGTVRVINGSMAEISTPFEGRVSKSFVKLGQKVSAGTPVFEIYSPEYFETVKEFVQAKQEKQLATTNYNRQKDLLEHGIGSKKEFEEAESTMKIADREYERSESSLLIFNVKPDEITTTKPLVVRSPIAGEIIRNNITIGQYLKNDAEPQAAVANLNKVWVVAQVKEKNISLINSTDSVTVITDAHPDKPIKGMVSYIGNLLDEQTRSVEVYLECKNDTKMLKPGMFANVSFTYEIPGAIVIPGSAVLQEDNHAYVFVQTSKNKFTKRTVTVSTGNEKDLIVNSGLMPSETIVSEGAIYLQ